MISLTAAIFLIVLTFAACRSAGKRQVPPVTCGFTCSYTCGDLCGTLTVYGDYRTEITADIPGDTPVSLLYDKESIVISADGVSYTDYPLTAGTLCPAVGISEAFYAVSQNDCTFFGNVISGTASSGEFSVTTDAEGRPVSLWLGGTGMQFSLSDHKNIE